MILREFILNISIVLLCVLSVSSEITINNTKTYIEVINSLSNYPETFLGGFKDADISLNCKKALRYYKTGLVNQEEWAIQMLDAMSKLQSGILEGNLYNLGAYDECQSIRDVKVHIQPKDKNIGESMTLINGKYCLGSIQLGRLGFYWAMCAPDACSADDLNKIIQVIKVPIVFTEDRCHDPSQDPEITDGDIAVITCFGIILAIMATSSVYDVFLRYFEKKTVHPLLLAFSVVTNGEKLFATKEPGTAGDQLECLSGIRSFSMMWVVLGHIFSNTSTIGATNMIKLLEFMTDGWTMYIRGATVAVDSFFLMGGVVMIYVYLKSTKNKQTFNVFLYYLHRYLRLTPALAAVLAVHLTILKHFGSGPFWNFIEAYGVVNCRKYWYGVLFYIQNYTNAYEMCIGHTWYLSVDTQLFVLSPLILFPIKRWPRLTLAAVLILTLASISSSFALAWVYELIDGNSLTATPQQTEDHSRLYYTATYSRAAPWLIGIIAGYFIYQIKIVKKDQPFKMNRLLNIFLWIGSIAVMITCVYVDKSQDEYDRLAWSSYIAFIRPAWAIGLSWIIFACVTGYGGPVNALLSARIFQVLGRLTYTMYLTHYTVLFSLFLSHKHAVQFSNTRVMYEFWSIFAVVFVVAVIWTLAFESPVLIIEKYIFGGGNKKKPAVASPSKPIDNDSSINYIGSPQNVENKSVESGLHRRTKGLEN